MKNKKVLFVCQNILEYKEKILPVFMLMTNKGYDIHLACDEEVDIAFVIRKYIIKSTRKMSYFKNMNSIKELKNILINEKYEYVHTLDNISSYLLYFASKNADCKYINKNVYVENVKKNKFKLLKLMKEADNLIVNNEDDYKFCKYKKYNTSVKLIYDLAIDFRKFNLINFQEMKEVVKNKYNLDYNFKYVSLIDINSDEKYVCKIIKEITEQNSDIVFLIKEANGKLIDNLKKFNCLEKVKVINDVKWLELLVMSDSTMIVNIYSYDMLMFVYALMLGIPVIVPKCEYMLDYIEELKNGFFCCNKNVQQAILSIGRSVNIPKLKLEELPKFNYSKISKFSVDKFAFSMSNIYAKVEEEKTEKIYIIEDLKKSDISERLIKDTKENFVNEYEIITLKNSKNDEKLNKFGIKIINFNIDTFNGKIKLKKYLYQKLQTGLCNQIFIYGSASQILNKNKINFYDNNVIVQYTKLT